MNLVRFYQSGREDDIRGCHLSSNKKRMISSRKRERYEKKSPDRNKLVHHDECIHGFPF